MAADSDSAGQLVQVGDRRLRLRNLEKVLYPAAGTTKGEVLSYYTAVAEVMFPHVADRPVTRKRWPDGVTEQPFFEKNLPNGTPEWVRRVTLPVPGSTKERETIVYPFLDDLPTLVWLANLAALELHVPQWRAEPNEDGVGVEHCPDRLVVDLDPGAPAGLAECVDVAFAVREILSVDGLHCIPVTSGGKGLQLYAPLRGVDDAEAVSGYAKRMAETLAGALPHLVVSRMTKSIRSGKVFIDWSQNNAAKTTIAPYSLRGREFPTAAAPRSWAELRGGELTQLGIHEVIERLPDGDPLDSVASLAGTPNAPALPSSG